MLPRALAVVVSVAMVLAVVAACDDGAAQEPCTNIPAGGCPLSHGVACEDPVCEAVYACRPNDVWELRERCPEREGGVRPVAADAASTSEGVAIVDASVDAPPGAFGGPGCASLQAPDCALGVALACGIGCCGCEDLFVCDGDGWSLWGTCGEGAPRRGEDLTDAQISPNAVRSVARTVVFDAKGTDEVKTP